MNTFLKIGLLLTLGVVCLCTAAIHPADPFKPYEDARTLHRAMSGLGTNEMKITNILTRRSDDQRVAISKAFKSLYKEDLFAELDSELSGDYWDLVKVLMTPLPEYYAKVLYDASSKDDSTAILDILITSSNALLKAVNEAYTRLRLNPNVELPTVLMRKNQLLSHNMIRKAFEGARNENQQVDVRAAIDAAKLLHNVGREKTSYIRTWTEELQVENIFVTSSYNQLRQIFKEYTKLFHRDIRQAFSRRGFHSDLEHGILNMISAIESTPDYYAKRLFEAMDGHGTNEETLIRIIVGRSEIDLNEIRRAFDSSNKKKNLVKWINSETSGDFEDALLSIVKSN